MSSTTTITHDAGTITPDSFAEYRAERTAGTIVHPISNSENVDYTLRPFDLRVGSFRLVFASATDADAAMAALTKPQALTLSSTARPGVGMQFVIPEGERVLLEPGLAGETTVFVPFREVQS
ncbi:hypothetical protein [Microbacterium immunditiarum]|uniref:Uncharacterized protein n=1 Tax=Microbacterium immunditiarum TaxID=337480 RepID=A0A7Y9GRZ6_9MICO|nr:hypothetical protein [Microbacterium immunditiarum]NYE20510.1 hypothetical protein [Microbacterium immunditiarum]